MGVMEEEWGLEPPADPLRTGDLTVDQLREQVIVKDGERTEPLHAAASRPAPPATATMANTTTRAI